MIRRAVVDDVERIHACMQRSARELGRAFYDERTNSSFVAHVATVDRQLVDDETYFVIEVGDPHASAPVIAACGGWSRRDKLFTGNDDAAGRGRLLDSAREPARVRAMFVEPAYARRGLGRKILDACETEARREGFLTAELMATLPGLPLYRACGYRELAPFDVMLPDGVPLPCVRMRKVLIG